MVVPVVSDDRAELTARWARHSATAVIALAALALAAWYSGRWQWMTLGRAYLPTAPLMAVLLAAVGLALRLRAGTPAQAAGRTLVSLLAALLLVTAWVLAAGLAGRVTAIELLLAPHPIDVGGLAAGRISPLACGAILVATIGLAGPWLRGGRDFGYERISALLLMFPSAVFLQGYLLGTPPFYGGQLVPVAAPSTVVLLVVSVGLLLLAGPDRWPLRVLVSQRAGSPASPPRRSDYVALASLPAGVIVASAWFWYHAEVRDSQRDAELRLGTYVSVKADQLGELERRLGSTAHRMRALAGDPAIGGGIRGVRALADALGQPGGTITATAFREDGTPAGAPARLREEPSRAREMVARALRADSVIRDDVHFAADSSLALTFWVPAPRRRRDDARQVIAMEVDFRRAVLALLDPAPAGYPGTEVGLFRREGRDAVVLSTLDGRPQAALRYRIPLDSTERISSQLLSGATRGGVTTNHRGLVVAFAGRPVPETGWWLVATAPVRTLASPHVGVVVQFTSVVVGSLLLVATLIGSAWYRRDHAAKARELALEREDLRHVHALQVSEARLSRALASGHDGIWEWDLATGSVFVSANWRPVLGVADSEQLPISAVAKVVHPDDVAAAQVAVRRHFRSGDPFSIEVRVVDAAGGVRWVWACGEAERSADGNPVRMTGAVSDVTSRRLVEESLRRTSRIVRVTSACGAAVASAHTEQELLDAVVDLCVRIGGYRMSWIGYAEHDPDKTVRPVAIAGADDGFVAGAGITWGDTQRGQGPTGRCIRTGEPQAVQNFLLDASVQVWRDEALKRGFASSCSVPLVVEGAVIGALMLHASERNAFDGDEMVLLQDLARDLGAGITSMRRRGDRDASQEQLKLFRQVVDQSNDAIYISDATTRKFVDVNERASSMLGYTRDEFLSMGPADINPTLKGSDGYDRVAEAVRSRGDLLIPAVHRRKDGTEVAVEIAASGKEVNGRLFLLGVARDVTERRRADAERERLERQLAQAQKMEVVGRLAGGVAHDFNNMLAVILGYADLTLASLYPTATPYEDLKEIKTAAERSAALTRQLLAFARLQVVTPVVLDPNEGVAALLKMLHRVIGEDIRLVWEPGAGVWPVRIDPTQLDQLLANLAVNSRDAMTGSGTLTIRTTNVYVAAPPPSFPNATPGDYVRIEVTDTGSGMSADTLEHLFEPFFTTKEKGKGTGLGMSIVYGIVTQNGGFVEVESTVGQGTTVGIVLPRSEAAVVEPNAAQTVPPRGAETVLVVEDEAAVLALAASILRRQGYSVLTAPNGPAALRLVAATSEPIHLTITDVVMPGMSGKELAEALGLLRRGMHILYMSGHTRSVLAGDGRLPEESMFLQKPFSLFALASKVREVLDRPAHV